MSSFARVSAMRRWGTPIRIGGSERCIRHAPGGRVLNLCKVRLIPDGNGDFTRRMGMLVDKRKVGFGTGTCETPLRDLSERQLYVAGDPGNPKDGFWRRMTEADRAMVTAPYLPVSDGPRAQCIIVV
jgi:hypothetical protein